MFFLDTASPARSATYSHEQHVHRMVAWWLFICCAMIFSMVILGGVTRLTGSGLSMVDWQPIKGIIPPLSEARWLELFEEYKAFPEFQFVNQDMDLSGFKVIFLFEYWHRVLGRLIGLAFFIPFVVFWWRGYLSRRVTPKLIFLFILGGLQGLLGWYMVKSGLVDNPYVSQYRLTAHLCLAIVIYGYMLYVACDQMEFTSRSPDHAPPAHGFEWLLVLWVLLMIASGGFVAGTHAGYIYNTFPDMNGQLIPDGLTALSPVWMNAFNNVLTIQFNHRILAYVLVILALINRFRLGSDAPRERVMLANLMLAAVALQVGLGILTLVNQVPVTLGAMHQAGALIVFSVAILQLYRRRYPLETV